MRKVFWLMSLFMTFSLASSTYAHYVWLERDGDRPARAYFGEWIDDIREKSGGMLDRIKAPGFFSAPITSHFPSNATKTTWRSPSKDGGICA